MLQQFLEILGSFIESRLKNRASLCLWNSWCRTLSFLHLTCTRRHFAYMLHHVAGSVVQVCSSSCFYVFQFTSYWANCAAKHFRLQANSKDLIEGLASLHQSLGVEIVKAFCKAGSKMLECWNKITRWYKRLQLIGPSLKHISLSLSKPCQMDASLKRAELRLTPYFWTVLDCLDCFLEWICWRGDSWICWRWQRGSRRTAAFWIAVSWLVGPQEWNRLSTTICCDNLLIFFGATEHSEVSVALKHRSMPWIRRHAGKTCLISTYRSLAIMLWLCRSKLPLGSTWQVQNRTQGQCKACIFSKQPSFVISSPAIGAGPDRRSARCHSGRWKPTRSHVPSPGRLLMADGWPMLTNHVGIFMIIFEYLVMCQTYWY